MNGSFVDTLVARTLQRVAANTSRHVALLGATDAAYAVRAALNAAGLADLLVVCDDLNLPLGKLRIRGGGSDGGQKGLRDISAQLGTDDYARLRLGIGQRGEIDAADFVLSRFRSSERPPIDDALILAAQAVAVWVTQGLSTAMNRFNGPAETGRAPADD